MAVEDVVEEIGVTGGDSDVAFLEYGSLTGIREACQLLNERVVCYFKLYRRRSCGVLNGWRQRSSMRAALYISVSWYLGINFDDVHPILENLNARET